MRTGGAGDRRTAEVRKQGVDAPAGSIVADEVERQGKIGLRIVIETFPLFEQRARAVRLLHAGLGQRVHDEGLLIQLPFFQIGRRGQHATQIGRAVQQHPFVHGEVCLASPGQAEDDIRRDRGVASVVGPPAPTAVDVLLRIDTLEPDPDLLRQPGIQVRPLDPQPLKCTERDDIRQEAAEGLLDALVGVVLQVGESAQHARGQARLYPDFQLAPGGVDIVREAHQLEHVAIDLDLAARPHDLGRGVAFDGQGDLHCVAEPRSRGLCPHVDHGLFDIAEGTRGPDCFVGPARGDRHGFRRAAKQRQAGGRGRVGHVEIAAGRVVDDRRDVGTVARNEEARQHRAHQEVLRRQDGRAGLSDQRIPGGRTSIHHPGGQIVGQRDLHGGLARRVGLHGGTPVGDIREFRSDLGAACVPAAASALAVLRKLRDQPVDVQHQGQSSLNAQGPFAVESIEDGAGLVCGQGQHRLIDQRERDIRGHALAAGIQRLNVPSDRGPGRELRQGLSLRTARGRQAPARGHDDLQLLVGGRDPQLHQPQLEGRGLSARCRTGLVDPLYDDDRDEHVGRPRRLDRQAQHLAVRRELDHLVAQDAAAFDRDQRLHYSLVGAGNQHLGDVAHAVLVFIRDELDAVVVLLPP